MSELRMPDYAAWWNGWDNCGPGWCDGTPTVMSVQNCRWGSPRYANVQPWKPNSGMTGENIKYIYPGSTVNWRYLTKDWRYVLVRVPNETGTDWGFMLSQCITDWGNFYGPDPNI